MRVWTCLSAVIGLALSGRAGAADSPGIDRSIRKEPAYESKAPLYCLVVFGAEAKVRVWLVLDGDTLYVDRNGNGDLTEPGERCAANAILHRPDAEKAEAAWARPWVTLHRPENRHDVETMRKFDFRCKPHRHETEEGPILSCWPEVYFLHVFQLIPREDHHDREWVKSFQERPFYVCMAAKGGPSQSASLAFASRPEDAQVLHFDGPRVGWLGELEEYLPATWRERGEDIVMPVYLPGRRTRGGWSEAHVLWAVAAGLCLAGAWYLVRHRARRANTPQRRV
jgi:hypothetical protein